MKKKISLSVGIVVILLALAYLLFGGLEGSVVYFVTPTELAAKGTKAIGSQIRLGGMVADGSITHDGPVVMFSITDGETSTRVVTTSTPPQMFQESMGAIVEGKLQPDGTFSADRLMLKHGNEYRPPEQGKLPADMYHKLRQQQ